VMRTLHLPHIRRDHRIDYPGAAALIVALVPLLIVAEQGREWGWASGRSIACFVIGAIGVVAFVFAERAIGNDALIPLRLFRGRTFSLGTVLNAVIGMGMFGGLACLPLYMQIVKGYSPTEAGLLMLPLMVGIMSGSVGSGQTISRTGRYKVFPIVGLFLLVAAMLLLHRLDADTSIVVVDLYALIFGLGLGFNMQTLVLAIQNAVPASDMGVATASATFFRQLGGTLGTAVFLSVLFNRLPETIGSAFTQIAPTPQFQAALADPAVRADPANAPVLQAIAHPEAGLGGMSQVLDDSSFLAHLDPRLARPFLVGFSDAITSVFLIGAGVLAVALVLIWFLPEEPLRTSSGIESQRAEAEAPL